MKREKKKLPGDVGTTVGDVVKEEFDDEGLPIINVDEPVKEIQTTKSKRQNRAVRINAVKTRIPLANGGSRAAFEHEIIKDPCAALLELAEMDRQHRVFSILKIED